MASSPSNSLTESATVEQVITEFFSKSLHIILESRSPYVSSRNYSGDPCVSSPSSSSSSSSGRPRDKWFNLALRDYPAALENCDVWRQSNLEPLVVDVVLVRRPSASDFSAPPPGPGGCFAQSFPGKDPLWPLSDDFVPKMKNEKIVERWIVQYEARKSCGTGREFCSGSRRSSGATGVSSQSSEIPALYKKTYKRSIVLLRSLYLTVRLLPAYKVFRALNSSGQIRPLSLSHRISSFVEPFTRAEDAEMNQFHFAPVDTPCGRLSLSVSYLPTLEDVSSEPSTPISTQLIIDYVGSPTTDPLKSFQSLPSAGPVPTHISLTRCHSWSSEHGAVPSVSPSPSPTYSDTHALWCNPNPCTSPHGHVLNQFPLKYPVSSDASVSHKKSTGFDEYWPSPPFSPSTSTSPSPPTHLHSGQSPAALLRSESAPVSISSPRLGRKQGLPPSPNIKATRPGFSSQTDVLRTQITTASAARTSPESRLQIRKESPSLGDFHAGIALRTVLSFGRGEVGNLSGLCSSPQLPWSSNRFSSLDEFDDSEFAFPFAVDDEELTDPCNRIIPSDGKGYERENLDSRGLLLGTRSPDAVVGALVRMLKKAPPLRQDLSDSVRTMEASRSGIGDKSVHSNKDMDSGMHKIDMAASGLEITTSGLFKSRTAADALEELMSYKEMKELLLKRGGTDPVLKPADEEPAKQ